MANTNTMDFKEFWDLVYETTHYKLPAYQAIADESQKSKLTEGQKLHRTFASDTPADNLGSNGEYLTTPFTDTDEFLIVNNFIYSAFTLKRSDFTQATLPVVNKYAQKTMNSIFTQIDATVLGAAYNGAATYLDAAFLGGTAGTSITLTVSNIQTVFSGAELNLRLQNVVYNPAAAFSGDFKLDKTKMVPAAVISAQTYSVLQQYLGSKTTALGDDVSRNGFIGKYLGFSLFVSNSLPWTCQIQIPTNPTAGDSITFLYNVTTTSGGGTTSQSFTLNFVSSIGTTAGNILIQGSASATATTLASCLSNLFQNVTTSGGATTANWVPFSKQNVGVGNTASTTTTMQQRVMSNTSAVVDGTTNTSVDAQINGMGNVPVSTSFTSSNNSIPATSQTQHNLFGVMNGMISVVIQRRPEFRQQQSLPNTLSTSASGRVATDYITWVPYGYKVFTDQAVQIVDARINTSALTTAPAGQSY